MWNWLKHRIVTKSWKFNDIICNHMKCKPIVSLTCCDSSCGRTSNRSSRLPRSKKKKGQDEVMQVVPNFLNQEQLINIVYLKKMGITSKSCILLNSWLEPCFFLWNFFASCWPQKRKKNILSQKHVWSFYQNIWWKQGLFFNLCGQKISKFFFQNSKFSQHCTEKQIFPQFCPKKLLGCKTFAYQKKPKLDHETLHITERHWQNSSQHHCVIWFPIHNDYW